MKKFIVFLLAYVCDQFVGMNGANKDYLLLGGATFGGTVVSSIYFALKSLAMGLTVVYFMYELNSKWAFEGHDMNMKSLFAPFGKLIAAVVIINQSDELWGTTFVQYYDEMIEWATKVGKDSTEYAALKGLTDKMTIVVGGFGVLELLIVMIFCVLVVLVCYLLKLLWDYKAVVFKFELLFRIAASPLAMADVYNGAHSNAWRWVKGFIGTTLYGCALIMIPKVGAEIFGTQIKSAVEGLTTMTTMAETGEKFNLLTDMFTLLFTICVIPAAELGCVGAVKQVLKEAAS